MGTKDLLQRIASLLELASKCTVDLPEVTMREIEEQVPMVLQLLDESHAALSQVQNLFEDDAFVAKAEEAAAGAAEQDDSLIEIGALISTEMAAQEVADLAFVASGDLRRCAQEVRTARSAKDPWQTAAGADKGLRHLRKGLISVESAIHEFEGREAPIRAWFDLDVSLEVRRHYSALRRAVMAAEGTAETDPRAALRMFQDLLAKIRASSVYSLLRYSDRRVMHHLMQRIQRSEGARSFSGRRRLWEDVLGFVQLLAQVNQREEIKDHDRQIIDHAYKTLFRSRRGAAHLSEDLLESLRKVAGRDDELALLVEEPDRFPLARWEKPLARLQEDLTSRPAPVGPGAAPF